MAKPARLVLPVVAGTDDRVTVAGNTVTIVRSGRAARPAPPHAPTSATIVLAANRAFALERTERPDGRAFSPQTGFLTAYLSVDVVPGEPTEVSVTVK